LFYTNVKHSGCRRVTDPPKYGKELEMFAIAGDQTPRERERGRERRERERERDSACIPE